MSDMFDEEDDLIEGDPFIGSEDGPDVKIHESSTPDARRRLEKMLEEKRLRDELDDFGDY